MGTQSQSAGALGGAVVVWVAALAGCGGRAAAEADRVCTPLPAAAAAGNLSTFTPPWPAEMASLAWGADHALYALGQWLQDGSVRRALLRSTDAGTSFCVMPAPEPIDQLAAVDGSPIMFGVTGTRTDQQSFQVVRSLDAGVTWQRIDRDLPVTTGPLTLAGVGAQGLTAWISDSSGGYWVSRDAGEHFQPATLPLSNTPETDTFLMTLLVDPELPGRAFATYLQLAGGTLTYPLYRTDDAGVSWRQLTAPEPDILIEMALTRGSRLVWVGTDRLWLSDDGGDSWRGGIYIPAATEFDRSGPVVSLRDVRANGSWTYRFSTDGGDTWYPTSGLPIGMNPPGELLADTATGTVLAATRLGLFRTRDRAQWTAVHISPHAATDVVFAGGDTLWVGAANAILTSRDRGASWTVARAIDGDLSLTVDPSNPSRGVAVALPSYFVSDEMPDTRVLRTTDGGTSWQDILLPRPTDPSVAGLQATIAADGTFYVSTYTAGAYGIAASNNGGATFNTGVGRTPPTSASLRAMAADPRDPRRVWLEADGGTLYETRDAGASWQPHAGPRPPADAPPRSAGIVFSGDAVVVAGPGGIARSTDGGSTWTAPALPGPPISADGVPDVLALRAAPDGRLLLTSYNRLYASSDGGATWTVAVEIPLWSSLGRPTVDPAGPDRVVLPFTQAARVPYLDIAPPIYPAGVLPWELSSLIEVSLP